jgi:hypothetical protein
MSRCEETTSELLSARLFIYTHSCYIFQNHGWEKAAQHTLKRIEEFQQQAPEARPPIMLSDGWAEVEAQIQALAKSDPCGICEAARPTE